jgi:hypothetical protein
LERRLLRPVFKFPDPKACAAELLTQIEWHEANHRAVKAGRASALAPWPADVTVPDHIAAEFQHIHDRLMSAERRAAESKRTAKRARRAARRLAAAVEKPEPAPTQVVVHGPPFPAAQAPALAPPAPATPRPMASLMY